MVAYVDIRERKWRSGGINAGIAVQRKEVVGKETGCSCSYMYVSKCEEEEEEKKKRKRLALKRSSFSCAEAGEIATRRDAK